MIIHRPFLEKLAAVGNCVEWTGAKRNGYGQVWYKGEMHQATHLAWFLFYERWPTKQINHRCDNPACVKIAHLYEGTQQQNIDDRERRGRRRTLRGEACPWAKLTDAQVEEIRALCRTRASAKKIAAKYRINYQLVYAIGSGRHRGDRIASRKPSAAQLVQIDDQLFTIEEISERAGVDPTTIRQRIVRGITGSDLLAGKHAGPRKQRG